MFNDFLSLASHGSLGFHSSTALLYRFLLGPLVFGFVGVSACLFFDEILVVSLPYIFSVEIKQL